MQEEVNQKTVALSIRTTKLTGKVLAAALGKVARALQKHHRKALTPQGRQSVKKLMNHYGGKSAMPYAKPLTEKQMEDYELKPAPGNPDRVRPSITARLKEGTRGQEPPKEPGQKRSHKNHEER